MGLKDLGFKYFKSIKELEEFKLFYETKITKKYVILIVPCELTDLIAKHVIHKFNDRFKAKIIVYTEDPDGVKHMKKYKNIIKGVA